MVFNLERQKYRITISGFDDFIAHLPPLKLSQEYGIRTVFRGHRSDKWKLEPTIARRKNVPPVNGSDSYRFEDELLARFQKEANLYLESKPEAIYELLGLAQHHGLPTRLLDWTENPLVALFFAVEEHPETDNCDGIVWSLQARDIREEGQLHEGNIYSLGHMDIILRDNEEKLLYFPVHVTRRMSAQQGCFTLHTRPLTGNKFVPLEERPGIFDQSSMKLPKLREFVIPASQKPYYRHILHSFGISYFSLFPGLEGLSKKLIWEMDNYQGALTENVWFSG